MFIPVSMIPLSKEPSKFVVDAHISLETITGFFTRLNQSDQDGGYIITASPGITEYYVTKETYDLLKSLVLRP